MHSIVLPKSLSREGLDALASALANAPRDADVWVLRGSDGAFCTGMDLAAACDADGDVQVALAVYARCLETLRRAPRPTIALVDGEASGGGVGLAAACDVVLATPDARFALPEALFGLLPSLVLPVLVERVSPQRARLLALSAASIDGSAALDLGLADAVIASDATTAEIAARARVLARVDAERTVELRRWMREFPALGSSAQLAHGAALTAERVRDPETRARIRRFLEDGTPPWVRP